MSSNGLVGVYEYFIYGISNSFVSRCPLLVETLSPIH